MLRMSKERKEKETKKEDESIERVETIGMATSWYRNSRRCFSDGTTENMQTDKELKAAIQPAVCGRFVVNLLC